MEWALLADVPPEELRQLLQVARRRRFARNEVVFHRDDPGDSLHLIVKGRFSIRVMTPVGQVATIAIRGPGESFGEMVMLDPNARRSATVTALEEAETFAVYRAEFEQLRRAHREIDDLLHRFLVREVRVLNERLLEALYLPVEKRVLRRLAELADMYAGAEANARVQLTQESLAELAGATRATVNRVLRHAEEQGTIKLERGTTVILDLDRLRRSAR